MRSARVRTLSAHVLTLGAHVLRLGAPVLTGLPLETGAFADPLSPSASLPQVFEDYGDAEHHLLYKPVSTDYTNVST